MVAVLFTRERGGNTECKILSVNMFAHARLMSGGCHINLMCTVFIVTIVSFYGKGVGPDHVPRS